MTGQLGSNMTIIHHFNLLYDTTTTLLVSDGLHE